MALDFSNMNRGEQPQETQMAPVEKIPEVVPYDMQAERVSLTKTMTGSKEVDDLVSKIEIHNLESIVTYGAEVAEEISKASDVVLNSMSSSQLNQSSAMLVALAKIMDQFDLDEIQEDPGFLKKMFKKAQNQMDKILEKYNTLGKDVDKIYIELRGYEAEIMESNRKLNSMFQANVDYYHELMRYILAGEQACGELTSYIAQRNNDMATSGDQSIQFELQSLQQAQMLLEQRVHDLRIAENVALQSVPMIKTMEFSNMNLVRKINSAFIITLPVFKQALAQAMMLKRQKIQAESMAALDEKTNELLMRNAQNTVATAQMTAQLASGSSIKIETLENSWKTIMDGIEETRRIQDSAQQQRNGDKVRLEAIKKQFEDQYSIPKLP